MTKAVSWPYPGGKGGSGVYQTIINSMPPHNTYIEAFLGAGSVLRHKRLAQRNVGIDLDEDVIQGWHSSNVPRLEVIHGDALEILNQWTWCNDDYIHTLLYCDPPYLIETRSSKRPIYRCELSRPEEHVRLLETLKGLPCMVMLSGYRSRLYDSIIGCWHQVDFQTRNRAGRATIETIWMNFPNPLELHDYRYLGQGFRERERIKRKRDRWKAKLLKMSELERQAVVSAINELSNSREHTAKPPVNIPPFDR
jgi:site-specific DNA-adenine methylase